MGSNPDLIYWDSCAFLHFLAGDHPLSAELQLIYDDWLAGLVTMVTSTLTMAEVLYVKCGEPPQLQRADPTRRAEIEALFTPTPTRRLVLIELSAITARKARDLHWDLAIKPKDAVHVASALEAHCEVMHTTDASLQSKSGQVGGSPILRIEAPVWGKQLDMGGLGAGIESPDDPTES